MKLDNRLQLVIPVEQSNGVIYVHSTPITAETFRRYHMVIAKTFNAIYSEKLGPLTGPRVAAMMLEDIAKADGVWEGPLGVEKGLIQEIRRLSNVIVPTGGPARLDPKEGAANPDVWRAQGWDTIMLYDALQQKMIDEDDLEVVENAMVFFIVVSSMHTKAVLPGVMATVCGLWNAQMSSLNSTAFAASLPTSTATVSSGAIPQVSALPS